MERLKKRSLILVLASVMTVTGACFADGYKNSLMSLEFEGDSTNSVNVILHTKIDDGTSVIPKKIDANTYIIMLPETDDKSTNSQKLGNNIVSVNKKTMPYTSNGSGYTKITIKTLAPNTELNAKKTLYKPSAVITENILEEKKPVSQSDNLYNNLPQQQVNTTSDGTNHSGKSLPEDSKNTTETQNIKQETIQKYVSEDKTPSENTPLQTIPQDDNSDTILWVLGFLTVLLVCIFIIVKSSRKMEELVGEKVDFSTDNNKNKKDTKHSQIKKTIRILDKMYEKPIKMPRVETNSGQIISDKKEEETNDAVIVDLDELFQSNTNSKTTETDIFDNDALDDFLNSFDIEAEEEKLRNEIENNNKMDELFEKYIIEGSYTFSQADIEKINELLNSEINDDTLKNISKYAVSNPIKEPKKSKNEILENFITNYTINQNISFNEDDVIALNKLINVELNSDFITDLTTNPERTAQMKKEIESRQVNHKAHEILTLNVKDMLPDLSEALKKQGDKKIEYEVKPQVVYYNDQYDVKKLEVRDELPDLTLDFDDPEYNKYRPSDNIELAAEGYDVKTLTINDKLPDLNDAIKHPEKYREIKTKTVVDEDSLLKSLSNVTFKPFYDGEESFEISNKFEDEDNIFKTQNTEENDLSHDSQPTSSYRDNSQTELFELNRIKTNNTAKIQKDDAVENLMNIINTQKNKRKEQPEIKKPKESGINKSNKTEITSEIRTCSVEGESFEILNTAKFNDNSGCRLCKNESGYAVIGYIRRELKILKKYEKLNSQRIQTRVNEIFENGTTQYIVRIGTNKFIINASDTSMEYVMDLC